MTTLDTAEVSRAGGRRGNEDCAESLTIGAFTCAVVADGLGGHRGGEVASRVAVDAVLESFRGAPEPTPDNVAAHVRRAHEAVLEQQRREPAMAQMRSTIVVLVAGGGAAVWGHVGDTRLYRLRGGRVVERTKDHSVSQALVDAGEVAPDEQGLHEDRSRLRRSLGKDGELGEAVHAVESLMDGDAFLLCTDGFWEVLSDTEIAADYCGSATAAAWLERLEGRVARRMTAGKDNYTAAAVRCAGESRVQAPPEPYPEPAEKRIVAAPAAGGHHRNRFALLLIALLIVGSIVVWAAPTIARSLAEHRAQGSSRPAPKPGGEPGRPGPSAAPSTNRPQANTPQGRTTIAQQTRVGP